MRSHLALAAGLAATATFFAPSLAHADEAPLAPAAQAKAPPDIPPVKLTRKERRQWRATDPVPPGYRVETGMRFGLLVPGAVFFAMSYGIAVAVGIGAKDSVYRLCLIPVVGPFLPIAVSDTAAGVEGLVLILDGVVQVLGATLFTLGVAIPKTTLVWNAEGKLHVSPVVLGQSGYGLGVGGSF
jgi:hypothetical protein